jgi:hypothetical protein
VPSGTLVNVVFVVGLVLALVGLLIFIAAL